MCARYTALAMIGVHRCQQRLSSRWTHQQSAAYASGCAAFCAAIASDHARSPFTSPSCCSKRRTLALMIFEVSVSAIHDLQTRE